MRLPPPDTWQWFESICHLLWREIWSDPNAQMNGRRGQPQHGVDIFGRPIYQDSYAGVQCKDKDTRLGSALTENEMENECQKATEFVPDISSFTIATSGPRDETLQRHARQLTEAETYPFEVSVWSWDDIEQEILFRPAILSRFYTGISVSTDLPSSIALSRFCPRDQFHAFFTRPIIDAAIAPRLKEFLIPVIYELSDNAFCHGAATKIHIECSEKSILLIDDGTAFDPTSQLDPSKTSSRSHVGSFVFSALREEFSSEFTAEYCRIDNDNVHQNRLELRFCRALHTFGPVQAFNLSVDMSLAYGRASAERLAESIPLPHRTEEIVLVITSVSNYSALIQFLITMLRRMPASMVLTVSLPRTKLLERADEWLSGFFDDTRLKVSLR